MKCRRLAVGSIGLYVVLTQAVLRRGMVYSRQLDGMATVLYLGAPCA